jgi:hypothetical protein
MARAVCGGTLSPVTVTVRFSVDRSISGRLACHGGDSKPDNSTTWPNSGGYS